jgi:transmembrane sensor
VNEKNNHIDESTLLLYIKGEASAVQISQVDQWLQQSADNRKLLKDLEKTWTLSGNITPKPVVVDVQAAWSNISRRISVEPARSTRVFTLKNVLRIAAVVVILAGSFAVFRLMSGDPAQLVLTAQNEVIMDTLPDGSVISLNKNSELTYPEKFASNERRVKLEGEAFFEIEPDQERPFIIELQHQSTVTVLGTSFNIEEKAGITEVFVKTGKVEFKSSASVLILMPGEKGVLDHQTGIIEKAQPEKIDFNEMFWLDQKLEFDSEPLKNVIHVLSQTFDTEIEVSDSTSLNCPLTTKFERESLEQILDVISGSFNLRVQPTDHGYILTGDGC